MAKRWRVTDHNGDTVFDADSIHKDPGVANGLYTARDYAKRVARDNSDPMHPPLQAVKDAD